MTEPTQAMEAARYQASAADEDLPPLSERWREIQGLHHWAGLLQPLDLELRRSIIRYGEFNQAIYDAFDSEVHSKYVGSCKYSKEEVFQKVGLQPEHGEDTWGYRVSRYLYATATSQVLGRFFLSSHSTESWSKESNWIGYVAVATDEGKEWLGRRDIVVVWRGTLRLFEWIDDFHAQDSDVAHYLPPDDDDDAGHWYGSLKKMAGGGGEEGLFDFHMSDVGDLLHAEEQRKEQQGHWYDPLLRRGPGRPHVEKGWLLIYTSSDARSPYVQQSARMQVLDELKYLLKKHEDEDVSITVVGHSLGASLAVLNAYDIAESGLNLRGGRREPALVTAITFGCPLVGDGAFKQRCEELQGLRILRVKNKKDMIALYPPTMMGYEEVGQELPVDHRQSPFVNQKSHTIGDWHNLEAHLHLVAGTHGPDLPFKLAVDRDPALINKSCNFLSSDLHIPASWWQDRFKGLVKDPATNTWHLPDRRPHRRPQPERMREL